MGFFSRLDCVTGEQIRIGADRKVYVLYPKAYGGGRYEAERYDGYGRYGSKDILQLVAEWNKHMIPDILRKIDAGEWTCSVTENDRKVMENFYASKPLHKGLKQGVFCLGAREQSVGVIMSCYDKDNARLDYPIKVTYCPDAVYEDCKPSPDDPNQGCD